MKCVQYLEEIPTRNERIVYFENTLKFLIGDHAAMYEIFKVEPLVYRVLNDSDKTTSMKLMALKLGIRQVLDDLDDHILSKPECHKYLIRNFKEYYDLDFSVHLNKIDFKTNRDFLIWVFKKDYRYYNFMSVEAKNDISFVCTLLDLDGRVSRLFLPNYADTDRETELIWDHNSFLSNSPLSNML